MISIKPKDLLTTPLLISKQTAVDNHLADWLSFPVDSLDIIGTYNLLYNASLLVRQRVANAICIDGIVSTEKTDLTFIPFFPPLTSSINIIWKKNLRISDAAKAFLDILMDESDLL